MYHTIGSKYEETKGIDGSELVKLIKADIKKQLRPEYKVLAQKQEYSGGWSIHFQIKNTGIDKYGSPEEREVAKKLEKKVSDIVQSYNFDDGDTMSDYFHVRFYSHIRIEK